MKNLESKCWGVWLLFLMILAAPFLLAGCRPVLPPAKEATSITVTETLHDTVFITEKDSSAYQALLECQNGKVVIKEVTKAKAGKHLNAPKVKLKDNVLKCDCEAEAQELLAHWKSKNTVKATIVEKPVLIDRPFTQWQTLQMWLGKIALLLILLIAAWGIYKLYKKIKP